MPTFTNLCKALAVSVALAFLLTLGGVIFFGEGVSIDPALDWDRINVLPYAQAVEAINAHTRPMSGWETMVARLHWTAFVTPAFFALSGGIFVGCLALLWWTRGRR